MKLCHFIIFLGVVTNAFGDGLPVDRKGDIEVPHTLITLTDSQKEELESLNTVTLGTQQWALLRKASPNTPKRLNGILPVTWHDCTCGINYDGIRMKDGRIAVIHEQQSVETIKWRINRGGKLTLFVDARGQFYLDGILVRYPLLTQAIRESREVLPTKDEIKQKQAASIEAPPGMSATDKVFEGRIATTYRELAAKGWNGGKVPSWLER